MPIIRIDYVSASARPGTNARLAEAARRLSTRHLSKSADVTTVTVRRHEATDWFIGETAMAERGGATLFLEILVTAGTNTKAEKAGFIEAVFAECTTLLGPLQNASYIAVRDVPGDSWGYGGVTQERRGVAASIAAEHVRAAPVAALARHGIR